MWVTADGVAHTVALPSPSELLTESALSAFKDLRKGLGNEQLEELLEEEESTIFDNISARRSATLSCSDQTLRGQGLRHRRPRKRQARLSQL
jgi:hypothetical protein